jgi:hypothetical protein
MASFEHGARQLADVLLMAEVAETLDVQRLSSAMLPLTERRDHIARRAYQALPKAQRASPKAVSAARTAGAVVVEEYEQLLTEGLYLSAGLLGLLVETSGRPAAELLDQALNWGDAPAEEGPDS